MARHILARGNTLQSNVSQIHTRFLEKKLDPCVAVVGAFMNGWVVSQYLSTSYLTYPHRSFYYRIDRALDGIVDDWLMRSLFWIDVPVFNFFVASRFLSLTWRGPSYPLHISSAASKSRWAVAVFLEMPSDTMCLGSLSLMAAPVDAAHGPPVSFTLGPKETLTILMCLPDCS